MLNKGNIFNDLATLSEAGISTLDAARRVAASYPDITAWSGVIRKLSGGHKLATALAKSGLVSPFEQEIISVAEFAGRTPQGLRGIANSYDKRRQRVGRLRAKIYLPFAILFIGIIVSSILTLAKNPDASVLMVLAQAAFKLTLAIIITKSILNLLKKDVSGFLNSSFLSNAKVVHSSEFYKHLFEQTVFGALLWNIKSGIDFKSGFSRVSKLLTSKPLKNKLLSISRCCGEGVSVLESINKAQLPITAEFRQVLTTAEASGRWEHSVETYLQQQMRLLDDQIDHAFEWAPRVYYALIVLIVISVII